MRGCTSFSEIALAVGIVVGAFGVSLVLRRLLVKALDRGDAVKTIGRLIGRFLTLLTSIGVVCAFLLKGDG